MTDNSDGSALQEDMIHEAARRARKCKSVRRAVVLATAPIVLLIVPAGIINMGGEGATNTLLLWAMLLISPVLPIFVWMNVEWGRAETSYSKLNHIFLTGHSDARQSVSSSAIGSLLEVTMTDGVGLSFLETLAALLVDLLKSVRAEEEVVLTANQRHILHELVMPGRWDWCQVREGPGIGEAERRALRTAAVHALAVLGNGSSIPVLERFARKTDDPDLRQTALQSIEQIRERLQYGPAEMLRASRASERPDTLLRAALPDKPHDHDPQQLLRADNATSHPQGKNALSQTAERTMPD